MTRFIEIQEISHQLKPSTVLIKNQGLIEHITGITIIKIRTYAILRVRIQNSSQHLENKTVNLVGLLD